MQRGGAFAAARVAPHERAPGLLVERIEAQQLLGMIDRVAKGALLFEEADQPRQHLLRTLTETFTVGIDPLAGDIRQHVASVQCCGFPQRLTVARQSAVRGGIERDEVHDRAGSSRHASVREPASTSASRSGQPSRRWCSSRRRLVRAWTSVDSGHSEPATR